MRLVMSFTKSRSKKKQIFFVSNEQSFQSPSISLSLSICIEKMNSRVSFFRVPLNFFFLFHVFETFQIFWRAVHALEICIRHG